jgi:hypothetical protein
MCFSIATKHGCQLLHPISLRKSNPTMSEIFRWLFGSVSIIIGLDTLECARQSFGLMSRKFRESIVVITRESHEL